MGKSKERTYGQGQINSKRYSKLKHRKCKRTDEYRRGRFGQTQFSLRTPNNVGSGKNRRKRTEAGPAEISGRDHVPERKKQRNHPPQRLQPDGTMATNNLCIFGYLTLKNHYVCVTFMFIHGFGTCKKLSVLIDC